MVRLRVNDSELAYQVEGNGPPLVLLHGHPFNRSMWRPQLQALSNSYRIVTPDLSGHGESDVVDPVTMDQMAADVVALMDNLQIERAVMGGLSMGGYVALALYKRFPLRVRSLVLANTRASADSDEGRSNRERVAKKALSEGMEAVAEEMIPKLFAPATLKSRPEIVATVREMIINSKPEGVVAAQRAMAQRQDHTRFLPEIIPPILIIAGAEDQLIPAKEAVVLHRESPGSRLEIIEGAGHLSNIEQAEQFNRILKEFLDDLEP